MENMERSKKMIIKKCHICGGIMESFREVQRCHSCHKPFLPLNYFGKIGAKNSKEFKKLFLNSDELAEDDLIKGINVLW